MLPRPSLCKYLIPYNLLPILFRYFSLTMSSPWGNSNICKSTLIYILDNLEYVDSSIGKNIRHHEGIIINRISWK